MKTFSLLSLLGILVVGAIASVPVPNTVTLTYTMTLDPNQLGGLTPSQYGSNFTAILYSSTSINTPTNQWPVVLTIPAGPVIAYQGPPGTTWTNQIATDTATRFYLMAWSNTVNGGVGPFSLVAPYYQNPSGTVGMHN